MPTVDKGMHWCGPKTSKIKHPYENDASSKNLCSYFGYIIVCFYFFVYLCWCLFEYFNCCKFLVICHFLLENESCKINLFSWFFVFFLILSMFQITIFVNINYGSFCASLQAMLLCSKTHYYITSTQCCVWQLT